MATQSLYRRYRPRRFAELKGQDHIVRALRDAVASGREGQAYLFSGPRGTGKTTSARILAKVLNCEAPVDGEPCCECTSCLAVENGTSYDVHELDAASNNGVDAMRDLIEKASLGTPGRHKVYILDEVHMLSRAAEAALLKTLEEPPDHVVFVLATTDPQKVSDTIRSRTQHLRFHLLPPDTLHEHVKWVAAEAGLDVSEHAIEVALSQGGGSARDTLSALELIATTGDDADAVLSFDELVDALADRHQGRALAAVAQAINLGRDPRALTEELIRHLRDGFLTLMAPELVQLPSARIDEMAERSNRLGAAALVRGIEVLGEVLGEMRNAPDQRLLLEVALVRLCRPETGSHVEQLVERIAQLEKAVDAMASVSPGVPVTPPPSSSPSSASGSPADDEPDGQPDTSSVSSTPSASSASSASSERRPLGTRARRSPSTQSPAPDTPSTDTATVDVVSAAPPAAVDPPAPPPQRDTSADAVRQVWESQVLSSMKPLVRALYAAGSFTGATSGDGGLVYELPNEHHVGKCQEHRAIVERALTDAVGAPVTLALTAPGGVATPSAGGGGNGGATAGHRSAPGAADQTAPEPGASSYPAEDEHIDLDDLVDAPPSDAHTPLNRLAEAFPGSELITESDDRP